MDLAAVDKIYDIAIIGFGRVGCPLGLSLEKHGFSVTGIDISNDIINNVNNKIMPFKEDFYDELIKESNIKLYHGDLGEYPLANVYIITVGTPLNSQIETDLSQIKKVIKTLISKIDIRGKLIILRSTVAPYTTEFIKNFITLFTGLKIGKDFYLSICPERIAEGKAYKELEELPQIIGVNDDKSFEYSENIFSKLGVKIIKCSYIEAELSKLFCNIYRYINFSIPNYFTYIANEFKVDIFRILDIMNKDYPRNKGLKSPGLAAGACLRKDFGMINEYFPQTDLILQAYKINEYMPKFYVDLVADKIRGKAIGILGYTFKSNTDDMRDSLVPKMIRYIERYVPSKIMINDPNLSIGKIDDIFNHYVFENYDVNNVTNESDIIFIAINHSEFFNIDKKLFKNKLVVDIWGLLKENKLILRGE